MTPLLFAPLIWGVTGGFSHCVGMCGIFVVACSSLNGSANRPRPAWRGHLLFHAGRAAALAALGAIAGALGSLVSFTSHVMAAQGYISIAGGTMLALFSLGQIGLVPALRIPEPNVMEMGGGRVRKLYARAIASRAALAPLLLGVLVGLLPCGLTYWAVLYVLTSLHAASLGAAAMIVFAAGTSLGLLTLAAGVALAPALMRRPILRDWLGRTSGLVMILTAGMLIYRGWLNLHSIG